MQLAHCLPPEDLELEDIIMEAMEGKVTEEGMLMVLLLIFTIPLKAQEIKRFPSHQSRVEEASHQAKVLGCQTQR